MNENDNGKSAASGLFIFIFILVVLLAYFLLSTQAWKTDAKSRIESVGSKHNNMHNNIHNNITSEYNVGSNLPSSRKPRSGKRKVQFNDQKQERIYVPSTGMIVGDTMTASI